MALLLTRDQVARLLSLDECIVAVEHAFRLHGEGRVPAPGVLGMQMGAGGFHVKAAVLPLCRAWFAAKVNGNFPGNTDRFGLPASQGTLVLADASNGEPLAVMDSIGITTLRTGAATAVAAGRLARPDSRVATICGCGTQGRVQLQALSRALPLAKAFAWDVDASRSRLLATELSTQLGIAVEATADLAFALAQSDACVTCTPSRAVPPPRVPPSRHFRGSGRRGQPGEAGAGSRDPRRGNRGGRRPGAVRRHRRTAPRTGGGPDGPRRRPRPAGRGGGRRETRSPLGRRDRRLRQHRDGAPGRGRRGAGVREGRAGGSGNALFVTQGLDGIEPRRAGR